jgi:hypothetical protein
VGQRTPDDPVPRARLRLGVLPAAERPATADKLSRCRLKPPSTRSGRTTAPARRRCGRSRPSSRDETRGVIRRRAGRASRSRVRPDRARGRDVGAAACALTRVCLTRAARIVVAVRAALAGWSRRPSSGRVAASWTCRRVQGARLAGAGQVWAGAPGRMPRRAASPARSLSGAFAAATWPILDGGLIQRCPFFCCGPVRFGGVTALRLAPGQRGRGGRPQGARLARVAGDGRG